VCEAGVRTAAAAGVGGCPAVRPAAVRTAAAIAAVIREDDARIGQV
jgi:hypothetical protein